MKRLPIFVKVLIWICCLIVIILLLMAAIFPYWASTPFGTKTTVNWINHSIPGKISVEKARLRWFGSQKLYNFKLQDPHGKEVISLKEFETDTSLLYLLLGGRHFKKTFFLEPYLYYELDEAGHSSLSKAIRSKKDETSPKKKYSFPYFEDALRVDNGLLIVTSPKIAPITISEIQISKNDAAPALPNEKLHFYLTAKTAQKENSGKILIDANLLEQKCVQLDLFDFPVEIIDQFQDQQFYTQFFGNSLNARVHLVCEKNQIQINGEVNSANVQGAFDGYIKDKQLHLNSKTQMLFTITPTFFRNWIAPNKKSEWNLASKAPMHVKIERMTIPLKEQIEFQDLIILGDAKIERAEFVHPQLGGYSLTHFVASFISAQNIELIYSGDLQGKEATHLEGTFSLMPNGNALFNWNYQGFPVSLIELFSPEFTSTIRSLVGPVFDLKGEGVYQDQSFDVVYQLFAPHTQLNGQIKGPKNNVETTLQGTLSLFGDKTTYLGTALYIDLKGRLALEKGFFSLPDLSGKVSNSNLSVDIRGKAGESGQPFSWNQVNLVLSGELYQFPLTKWIQGSSLNPASFVIMIDGPKEIITGNGKGVLQLVTNGDTIVSNPLELKLEVKDWIQNCRLTWNQALYNFQVLCEAFPITGIQRLFESNIDLSFYFGSYANIDMKGVYSKKENSANILQFVAKGENFTTQFAINFDGTLSISSSRPATLHWVVSPQHYEALVRMFARDPQSLPTFSLVQPASIDLVVEHLTCPAEPPKKLNLFLCQSGIVGTLKAGLLVFKSQKTNESMIIQNLSTSIRGENFSQAIDIEMKGALFATNIPQSQQSGFAFQGKMLNLWTPDGKFNREGMTLSGALNLDLIPVREFTGILPIDPQWRAVIQAVLGDLVNARISGEVTHQTGPVNIDIKASNLKALLPLQLQPHSILLRDFIDAEITLTQAVNETLLKDINPILITGAYSDHPLKVQIDPTNFVVPIHPFSVKGIVIGKGIFDIGRITVKNGGQIQSLMQFLKAKEVSPDGTMEAWFTPIYLSLKDGISTYQRFDALFAGSVHIALWGKIDLINNRVQMTLGIAPSTLKQRLHVVGLAKQDLFQVKMRGTTERLELDWSSAYTRIGILIARTAGGHIGYIVGGIVEQIVNALGEEPAPPPTTVPFPWDKEKNGN